MDIRHIHVADPSSPVLIMVPGFFTQPIAPGVVIDRSWDNSVASVCRTNHLNGQVLRWDSGNILDINLRASGLLGLKSLESALATWRKATESADLRSEEIAAYVRSIPQDVYLVGHSLGGKIALRVAEQTPVEKLITLAAAVDVNGVNYQSISANVSTRPIVCYSRKDRVLSTLFACGQSSNNVISAIRGARVNPARALRDVAAVVQSRAVAPALGLVGVPETHKSIFESRETPLRHAEYADHFARLWRSLA
jgi:pimeloyl-ACP methyl ester carboxylesterase